ncbi:MAG: hypothetical protein R3F60_25685 [bacterium]
METLTAGSRSADIVLPAGFYGLRTWPPLGSRVRSIAWTLDCGAPGLRASSPRVRSAWTALQRVAVRLPTAGRWRIGLESWGECVAGMLPTPDGRSLPLTDGRVGACERSWEADFDAASTP